MLGNYNTAQETADKLGIKKVTVLQYLKLGYLEGEMFGSQWAVHQNTVNKRKAKTGMKCDECNKVMIMDKGMVTCDCVPF